MNHEIGIFTILLILVTLSKADVEDGSDLFKKNSQDRMAYLVFQKTPFEKRQLGRPKLEMNSQFQNGSEQSITTYFLENHCFL